MIPSDSLRGWLARWYLRNYEDPWFDHVFRTVFGGLLLLGAIGVAVLASWDLSWGALASMLWTFVVIRLVISVYNQKGES